MKLQRIARSLVHRAVIPIVPPANRLRVIAWSARTLEAGEPELANLELIVQAGCRTAVDAGANVGLYALRLARLAQAVWAFEINPEVTGHLQRTNLPNVRIVHTGLSDAEQDVTLYVPVLNGKFALNGWASLTRGNCPEATAELEIPGRVRPLDDFCVPDVDFIKIDVEGHELQVLRGARETLRNFGPRILAELRDPPPVLAFLGELGYRARRPDEFGIRNSPPWMHVFDVR